METDGHAEDTLKGADWALPSRAGFEGLAMCSRVEMNSLLIQSKCNGNLPSIYQLYNLFTTPSRGAFRVSIVIFLAETLDTLWKNFAHLSLLASPEMSG